MALRLCIIGGNVASCLLGARSVFFFFFQEKKRFDLSSGFKDTRPQGLKDKKHVRKMNNHQLVPPKPAAQDSFSKKPSNGPKKFSPRTGAAGKVPAMGKIRSAVAEELSGMNGLLVKSRPPGTTEPAGRPAYCCPVEAANDETDNPAVFKWSSRIEQVRLSRAVCAARVS